MYINQSLFNLVEVIEKLNEKAKHPGRNVYVPYRYSMLTMMLRDSIGGNCMARMIATMHADEKHLGESLSTCLFSRSVALIKNQALKNEATDPAVVIRKLKAEISSLKAEIAMLRGEEVKDHLEPQEVNTCNLEVE